MEKKAIIIDSVFESREYLCEELNKRGYDVNKFRWYEEFFSLQKPKWFWFIRIGEPMPLPDISLAYTKLFYVPNHCRSHFPSQMAYQSSVNLGIGNILRLQTLLPNAKIIVYDSIMGPMDYSTRSTRNSPSYIEQIPEETMNRWEEPIRNRLEERGITLVNLVNSDYRGLTSHLPSEEEVILGKK